MIFRAILAGLLVLIAGLMPAAARPLTPQDLVTLRRVSSPAVSPDGATVVYALRETDLAADRGRFDLFIVDLNRPGAAPVRLLPGPNTNETDPAFGPDGRIWFLSDRSGSTQLWHVSVAGSRPVQATRLPRDVAGFRLSPRGDRVAVWLDERKDCDRPVCSPTAADPKASGRAYSQLFVRHWDRWTDGTRSRLLALPIARGVAGAPVWVSRGLDGDVPSKPFGGAEEVAWSPDGRTLYFALREAGRTEAWSTNLDIFAVPVDGARKPANLTAANKATDTLPAVSPDGRWLAWVAMTRPGYESDRQVIQLRNLANGRTRALTADWDRSVDTLTWAPDSSGLYVTAQDHFDRPLFRVDLAGGPPRRLSGDGSVGAVVPLAGGDVLTLIDSLTAPADLYRIGADGGATRLTAVNADKLDGVDLPTATRFSFTGAEGATVWGYAVKPAGLAAGTRAPVAYLIHGGPQGSFGNGWSYRWNPAVFAGAGYGAVMVDFHGSTGYGQAFTDAINQDWGGKPLADLKAGLDAAVRQFDWLDGDRACALGGSYGGYMANWIAGQWPDRFRCLVTHAGVFDARAMAFETEELWFDEWEHGGPYWERAEVYERANPVHFVDRWKTPMLVIHGERDFRIPYTQGLAAFTALQRRGVPSRLLIFPDENHWILRPQNSLQWHEEVLDWLARWTR